VGGFYHEGIEGNACEDGDPAGMHSYNHEKNSWEYGIGEVEDVDDEVRPGIAGSLIAPVLGFWT
jgi:hypothetical protein